MYVSLKYVAMECTFRNSYDGEGDLISFFIIRLKVSETQNHFPVLSSIMYECRKYWFEKCVKHGI